MADTSNQARFLNPWLLQFQKMGLELICPLCLKMLNRPILLPCNHIICDSCTPTSTQFGSECECPICKQQYADRETRPAPYMESMVTIYRSLDAAFSANLFQPASSDVGRVPQHCPVLHTTNDDLSKESVETREGNSSNGQSMYLLTSNRGQVLSHGEGKLIPAKSPGWAGTVKHNELGAEQIDIDQVTQSSPGSPPSFGGTKDIDDSSDPGCCMV